MTKKKKLTNPIMTEEWYQSLVEICVLPEDHAKALEIHERRHKFGVSKTLSEEYYHQLRKIAEDTPINQDLIDYIKMYPSTEGEPTDAEGNPLPEAPGHRKERLEGLPVPVFQSTAAPLRGDGGRSIDAIKLDDAYYTIKRLLDDNLVTSREVCEFVDAVERLIER